MKPSKKQLLQIAGPVLGGLVVGLIGTVALHQWRAAAPSRFEANARRAVSGDELQRWAVKLVAGPAPNGWEISHVFVRGLSPEGRGRNVAVPKTWADASVLGTNFPRGLLGLDRTPPMITIFQGTTNLPGWVTLTWSSREAGAWGFHIGPATFDPRPFIGFGNSDPWQAGVYFWRP